MAGEARARNGTSSGRQSVKAVFARSLRQAPTRHRYRPGLRWVRDEKGPAASRRPTAAREAYSLYVSLGGGLRPASEASPQESLRRQSRRWNVEHSDVAAKHHRSGTHPESWRNTLAVPLRARAPPAHRFLGVASEGAAEAPADERSRWGLIIALATDRSSEELTLRAGPHRSTSGVVEPRRGEARAIVHGPSHGGRRVLALQEPLQVCRELAEEIARPLL